MGWGKGKNAVQVRGGGVRSEGSCFFLCWWDEGQRDLGDLRYVGGYVVGVFYSLVWLVKRLSRCLCDFNSFSQLGLEDPADSRM